MCLQWRGLLQVWGFRGKREKGRIVEEKSMDNITAQTFLLWFVAREAIAACLPESFWNEENICSRLSQNIFNTHRQNLGWPTNCILQFIVYIIFTLKNINTLIIDFVPNSKKNWKNIYLDRQIFVLMTKYLFRWYKYLFYNDFSRRMNILSRWSRIIFNETIFIFGIFSRWISWYTYYIYRKYMTKR